MLHLKNISKEFAGKPLFTDISWHLKKGERVGLVGENGAGKSTIMRIIAGQVELSSGELQFAKGATVGYLPQDGLVTRGTTLFEEALSALAELQSMEEELRTLTIELETIEHSNPRHTIALDRFGHLQEEFKVKGGYTKEADVGVVLTGLGFFLLSGSATAAPSPVAGKCGLRWQNCYCRSLTFSCWTNRPTTSI